MPGELPGKVGNGASGERCREKVIPAPVWLSVLSLVQTDGTTVDLVAHQ